MYYYVYVSGSKTLLLGPYTTESEAEAKGRELVNGRDDLNYEIVNFPTRDISTATRMLKASMKSKSVEDVTSRVGHVTENSADVGDITDE